MEPERESIFSSALRCMTRTFFGVIGFGVALVIVSLFFMALSSPHKPEEKTTFTILPDLNGNRELVSPHAPAVLQLNIHGVIGDPYKLDTEIVQNILIDSRSGLLKGDRVKAILLNINTPGGTVVDSDNIYRMIKKYKERYQVPVYAYVDGLCASGGMYVASSADKIYASPASTIGSVGVIIGPFFNFVEGIGKIGVKAKTLTQGIDKDMMNPFRTWKPGEDDSLKAIMEAFYERFVTIVTDARPRLSKTRLVHEYGAQVFDSTRAQEYGYVDVANADYDEALFALMKSANINPEEPYQLIELEPKRNVLADLMSNKSPLLSGQLEHVFSAGTKRPFVIRDQFAYIYEPYSQ